MARTIVNRSLSDRLQSVRWDDASPLSMTVQTPKGELVTRHGVFVGGRSDGVEIVSIDTSVAVIYVLPTRGMAIWNIQCGATRFGWDSPVDGPVHPSLVPTHDPSGLGWLEGFDELLVRCGLESNGAPEFEDNGALKFPLHGRIGNLPADGLQIEYDEVSGRLELIADLRESRLFFSNLRLQSRLRVHAGSTTVEILDDVTNDSSTAAEMQLLYHINVGTPVLDSGTTLLAPIDELAPKDSLSAGEIDQWNEYGEPESGYKERVYFAKLRADESNLTAVMLKNADESTAFAVTYGTKTLPRFVLWKNTSHAADGYVTGLEPATNYPNTRSYESSQERVVTLEPEETASFRLKLDPMTDSESIAAMQQRIEKLSDGELSTLHRTPRPGWSPGA